MKTVKAWAVVFDREGGRVRTRYGASETGPAIFKRKEDARNYAAVHYGLWCSKIVRVEICEVKNERKTR